MFEESGLYAGDVGRYFRLLFTDDLLVSMQLGMLLFEAQLAEL
jgi:hypothetical protein